MQGVGDGGEEGEEGAERGKGAVGDGAQDEEGDGGDGEGGLHRGGRWRARTAGAREREEICEEKGSQWEMIVSSMMGLWEVAYHGLDGCSAAYKRASRLGAEDWEV